MDNRNWKPGGTFFKPAAPGLSIEELAKRAERESTANHGFALVMSNGPMPSEEAVAFMQKYVDGECTLEQALALMLKHHGLDTPSPEPENAPKFNSAGTGNSITDIPDADEKYWDERLTIRPGIQSKAASAKDFSQDMPRLFDEKQKEDTVN
jgi:hypothetical protein